MIKPLHLGNKTFPTNIIQGPLAGVSCAPFRLLTWKYGKPAFSCTEMISCKALLNKPKKLYHRYIAKDPNEGPVCYQLFGNNPEELAKATKIITDYGADLIDLNCGCPVKKVRRQGAGSSLLSDAPKLYQMICAMKQNTDLPVSVKIRVEGNGEEKFNLDIAKAISDAGADFLVVHGRRWTEHYETPVHHDQIQFFVEQMNIPIIGNGDIFCVNSLKKMLATGCAGVMLARSGVGQPWLTQKLIAEINQQPFINPTPKEIGSIFLEHVQLLIELFGEERFAILQARKLIKYYARGLHNRKDLCIEVYACNDLDNLTNICLKYFI